jgi:molybdate transport system ATP-binding protein
MRKPFMDQQQAGSHILEVSGLSVKLSGEPVLSDINISIGPGESLAVVGGSGSGKTTLVKALAGQIFYFGKINFNAGERISVIFRQHRFNNLSNLSNFYYQQRFNSFDADDSRTVEQELVARGATTNAISEVLELLGITHVRNTGLIQLSNGEHKRFQIAEALLEKPDWILLDSPYIGLDVTARAMLNSILDKLMEEGVHVLLVTGTVDIPSSITHIATLEQGRLSALMERSSFVRSELQETVSVDVVHNTEAIRSMPSAYAYDDFEIAVRMVDVHISYGDKIILDNINWEVKKGECWAVSGHNGSGKSTLLSLINGDNPQAFANQIWLFDKRKGTGESIWDIKKNIGYISPELHHYFDTGTECLNIVASGLFDTMGLFRKLNEEQVWLSRQWMDLLHIQRFEERMFQRLSDSEQRRVLLARALVKNPPMLILDEPCQGMDGAETREFISIVDGICKDQHKTLIYVTHYEAELPPCINNRILLKGGKLVN